MKTIKSLLTVLVVFTTVLITPVAKAAFPVATKTVVNTKEPAQQETLTSPEENKLDKEQVPAPKNEQTKGSGPVEPFGLVSFIAAFISLFIFGIPLGLLAIIFGIVSLTRFNDNPGKYSGKAFAIIGMLLGALSLVAVLIILASL